MIVSCIGEHNEERVYFACFLPCRHRRGERRLLGKCRVLQLYGHVSSAAKCFEMIFAQLANGFNLILRSWQFV